MRNRNKTPNTKLQAPEKHQAASYNGLGHHEGLGLDWQPEKRDALKYPEPAPREWVLSDGPNGQESNRHPFDIEERTAKFGEAIVRFSKKIPREPTNNRLTDQLVGCGTSVGANYLEANASVSKKDFRFSISRCVKEAKETKFFLRRVAASEAGLVEEARELYREGHELHRIFASMFRKGQK